MAVTYYVDLAKSDRSTCKITKEKIPKGYPRFARSLARISTSHFSLTFRLPILPFSHRLQYSCAPFSLSRACTHALIDSPSPLPLHSNSCNGLYPFNQKLDAISTNVVGKAVATCA